MKHRTIGILAIILAGFMLVACGAETPDNTTAATIPPEDRAVVACLGDSITFGAGVNKKEDTYPSQLQALLGDAYTVQNFGGSGRTLLKEGMLAGPDAEFNYNMSIWESAYLTDSLAAEPDIVIIALGTNDAKTFNWNAENFRTQYAELIGKYRALDSKPAIYLVVPPPVFGPPEDHDGINGETVSNELTVMVKEIAEENGCGLIDLYSAMEGRQELFADGVHPNAEGNALIAQTVYAAIQNAN